MGPFEDEREAREAPAVRAVYAAFDADPGPGKMTAPNHRMLCEALSAAGVEPAAFEHRILLWLAGWEPATCAVIAALITRASAGAPAGTAAQLASVAGWIDEQLDNERADRQYIAEGAAARIRDITLQMLDAAQHARQAATTSVHPDGSATFAAADLPAVRDALDVAADELRDRAANCGECDAHPAGLCTTCESRLSRAEGFDKAAVALGGAR